MMYFLRLKSHKKTCHLCTYSYTLCTLTLEYIFTSKTAFHVKWKYYLYKCGIALARNLDDEVSELTRQACTIVDYAISYIVRRDLIKRKHVVNK